MKSTLITVVLRMTSPGGVSAPEEQRWEDAPHDPERRVRNVLPLRTDPFGDPYIPGSTIAGSLRAHCRSEPVLAGKFGSEPGRRGENTPRVASDIQVLGTTLKTSTSIYHTRTAIDRRRAAARNLTLRSVEMLPAGTELTVTIRWNDATDAECQALIDHLKRWMPTIGHGASVGAGWCVVTAIGHATYDLSTEDGLADWLAIRGRDDYPSPEAVEPPGRTPLRAVTFRIVDAVHVGDGGTRKTQKHDVATIVKHGPTYVIPATGIKGVLRARAEYICASLRAEVCQDSTCGACRPCRLFGHGATDSGDPPRRAAIAIRDAPVRFEQNESRQHVAIDRFTAGARDELLFTHDVLVAGEFDLIIEQLAEVDETDLALIDAILLDLDAGLIGLGACTTAGYGTVRAKSWARPSLSALSALLPSETR